MRHLDLLFAAAIACSALAVAGAAGCVAYLIGFHDGRLQAQADRTPDVLPDSAYEQAVLR